MANVTTILERCSFVRQTGFRLTLFGIYALLCQSSLLLHADEFNLFRDAQYLLGYEEHARISVAEYLQLPLWDPYACGGLYALGSPQTRFVSPSFLLTLLFGTHRGAALTAFFMMWLGLEGMFRYLRAHRIEPLGAFLAAPILPATSFFASATAMGWFHFYGFMLAPWIARSLLAVLDGRRMGIAAIAALFTWMIGFGGTYPAPFACVWCAFELGYWWVRNRPSKRMVGRATLMLTSAAILTAALAAVRVWPLLETLAISPPEFSGFKSFSALRILPALFVPPTFEDGEADPTRGLVYCAGLFLPALLASLRSKRARPWVVLIALAVWISVGRASLFGPYHILQTLPIIGGMRHPERFLLLALVGASALTAVGVNIAARHGAGTERGGFFIVAMFLCAANALVLVVPHHQAVHARATIDSPDFEKHPFVQSRGNRWIAGIYASVNRGSLACFDDYPVPMSPHLRGDLQSEVYLSALDPDKVRASNLDALPEPHLDRVSMVQWSPQHMEVHIDPETPSFLSERMIINQNYHPGWHAQPGPAESFDGLLSTSTLTSQVRFTFVPRSAWGGFAITLSAAFGLLLLLLARSASTSRLLAAVAIPVLTAIAIWFGTKADPSYRPPVPRSPGGAPIYAAPQPKPRVVGTLGKLLAVHESQWTLSPRHYHLQGHYQLLQKAQPGTRIILELRDETGNTLQRDSHTKLSGAIRIDQAPINTMLLDDVEHVLTKRTQTAIRKGRSVLLYIGLIAPPTTARTPSADFVLVEGRRAKDSTANTKL